MVKGSNKVIKYTNLLGVEVKGNQTEIDFYKNCEKAKQLGAIKDFKYQIKIELLPEIVGNQEETIDATTHTLDFVIYRHDGTKYIIDTKGSGGMKSHDKVGLLKRLLFMAQNPGIKYYMISQLPGYLGRHWVDSTSGNDLLNKAKDTYHILYPWSQTRSAKKSVKMSMAELNEYYSIKAIDRLFYTKTSNCKKTRKAKPNPQQKLEV